MRRSSGEPAPQAPARQPARRRQTGTPGERCREPVRHVAWPRRSKKQPPRMRLAIASGYDSGGDQSDEQHPRGQHPEQRRNARGPCARNGITDGMKKRAEAWSPPRRSRGVHRTSIGCARNSGTTTGRTPRGDVPATAAQTCCVTSAARTYDQIRARPNQVPLRPQRRSTVSVWAFRTAPRPGDRDDARARCKRTDSSASLAHCPSAETRPLYLHQSRARPIPRDCHG